MEIKAVRYTEKYKNDWNLFIDSAKNGLFFFNRNFMDYHSDRFTDHSLLFFDGNKIISVFPANENDNIIYSHQGLTFGSLILDSKIKINTVLEIFDLICNYYREKGFREIIYKAIPSNFSLIPAQEDLYALYRLNSELIRRDISSVINLKSKISYSNSPNRHYKKCQKMNLEIKQNDSFKDYWRLLSDVLSVKYDTSPTHSLEEIERLALKFPNNIKLYEVRTNEELLCGTVIFDFGTVAHTQYLANSEKGKEIGALDYLLIDLIENQYKDKQYFSFGISTENQGKTLNSGLINQKEMYGGRGIVLDFYKIIL